MAQENMLPCVAAFLQLSVLSCGRCGGFGTWHRCSPVLLRLINTPEEIFADSVLYLRIYFIGTLFNILYNMGAGVLQAVADTRHPLYYLCAASAVNIVLDVVFVAVFRWVWPV